VRRVVAGAAALLLALAACGKVGPPVRTTERPAPAAKPAPATAPPAGGAADPNAPATGSPP
jgi:hypothetical protein